MALAVLAALGAPGGAAAGGTADGGPAVAASGPSEVLANATFSHTVTVSNARNDGVTLQGVTLQAGFPDVPAKESNGGLEGATCLGDGNGHLNCALGDLAPGASAAVTFTMYAHGPGTLHHPFSASSSTPAANASGEYDVTVVAVTPPPPLPSADLLVQVTDAVGTGGLNASHTLSTRSCSGTA